MVRVPSATNEFCGSSTLQPRSMLRPSLSRTFHFDLSIVPLLNSSFHTIFQPAGSAGGLVVGAVVAGLVVGAVVAGLVGVAVVFVGTGSVVGLVAGGGGSTVAGVVGAGADLSFVLYDSTSSGCRFSFEFSREAQ